MDPGEHLFCYGGKKEGTGLFVDTVFLWEATFNLRVKINRRLTCGITVFSHFYWRRKVRHTFHFNFLTNLATIQYLQSTSCSFSKARATSIIHVRNSYLKKIEIKMYNIHLIYI